MSSDRHLARHDEVLELVQHTWLDFDRTRRDFVSSTEAAMASALALGVSPARRKLVVLALLARALRMSREDVVSQVLSADLYATKDAARKAFDRLTARHAFQAWVSTQTMARAGDSPTTVAGGELGAPPNPVIGEPHAPSATALPPVGPTEFESATGSATHAQNRISAGAGPESEDVRQIRATLERLFLAWRRRDIEMYGSCWSADAAREMGSGGSVDGKKEILRHFRSACRLYDSIDYDLTISAVEISDRDAVVRTLYRGKLVSQFGLEEDAAAEMYVLRKDHDGDWRITKNLESPART